MVIVHAAAPPLRAARLPSRLPAAPPAMRALLASALLTAPRLHLRTAGCHASARPSGRPKAKQSLGQNFLSDATMARRIVEGLDDASAALPAASSEDGRRVIELGPGQGALTDSLLATYPQMTAAEIDERMIAVLRESFPGLTDLREGDMLQLDLQQLADEKGGCLSLISNTPFCAPPACATASATPLRMRTRG